MLKRYVALIVSLCCVSFEGCRSPSMSKERVLPPHHIAGMVETVNQECGYLILRCSVVPPVGVEAEVYRNRKKVARVRFSSVRNYPCVSADILSGQPARNDLLVY